MATIFIPADLRALTAGVVSVDVAASTVDAAVAILEDRFPGIASQLCQGAKLRPGLMVSINGAFSSQGLRTPVSEHDEIHFLPAIGGG